MRNNLFRMASIGLVTVWLGLLVFIPLLLIFITSLLTTGETTLVIWHFSLSHYTQLFHYLYFRILLQSLILSTSCTILCLLIGYPAAYYLAKLETAWKPFLVLLFIIPFWTSSLIRTYAIMAILKTKGLLNTLLLSLGIIHHPLQLLYSNAAVLIGSVYDLLPFMILPLYANIEKLDNRYLEAASDLGANRFQLLTRIILPLTSSGILAGSLLVFLPCMTLFYIPVILGGTKSLLVGNLIQMQFLDMHDWPGGAATSIVLTVFMSLLLWIYRKYSQRSQREELLI